MVFVMDSAEANTVLNEIISVLGDSYTEKPLIEIQNRVSAGYSVCIKTFLGAAMKQEVEAIAQKHKLIVSEESEGLALC
jgi:hypothetical protein